MRETQTERQSKSPASRSTIFPTVRVEEVPLRESSTDSSAYRPMVLVVDDETVNADTLTEILNRKGYAAIAAYDGETALENALLIPPELLISDVVLPGMSGIDLAITLTDKFPDCKVLLFSGQVATASLLAEASRAGHQFELLSKPLHPTDLLARMTESLKSSRAQSTASA